MVPVVSNPGKPKPPTPPKPVHYLPVNINYKRLIDPQYAASQLLQLNNNNNYDTLLDRSLTDDTAPLIEEEAERPPPPAVPSRVKPPLLPKPQHILPPPRNVLTTSPTVRELRQAYAEEKRHSTNPFLENDDNNNINHKDSEVTSPTLSSTNPFENLKEEAKQQQETTTTTYVEETFRSLNPFESLSTLTTTTTTTKTCGNRATQNFDEILASRLNDSSSNVFEKSFSSVTTTTTSLETSSGSVFNRLSDFSSLEDIHKQFNSDKECLIDTSFSSLSSNKVVRKHVEHQRHQHLHHGGDHSSNRSSWRSNSDLETEDESRSLSSSNNDSSVNGSPVIGGKAKEGGGDEQTNGEPAENNSAENSYSVPRRLKSWLGSFGKGSKAAKRRDSTFYVDSNSESENKSGMWETASVSSAEEKNDSETVVAVQVANAVLINGVSEPKKREEKALNVVKELISSEKTFIDVLKLLTEDFVAFVRSADRDNTGIPETELVKIINYLPQLRSFNEELLHDFETRLANWSSYPKISDIVIKKGPFLKLFSTYIQNFENQCSLLDDCCHKYHRFGKAVKNFEALDRCKKLTLKHYMLKPIQRLPQYRLILNEYLSQQTSESIDYEDTQRALNIVRDAAEHANRSVEQELSFSKLLRIQSRLGNYEIIKPGREFVKEGELYKLSRKEMQQRYFILLNDCLLYTRDYGTKFGLNVKYKLSLGGMKVFLPQVEDYNNEFSIISTAKSFILRANSSDERESWISALEKTIKEHNRKQLSFSLPLPETTEPLEIGKEAPIWVPDARVTMCQVCTAEFTFAVRRHHCRACGKVVCNSCSDNKAPLQFKQFRAARVCDGCYQYLWREYTDPGGQIMDYITEQSDLSGKDPAEVYSNIKRAFKERDPSITSPFPLCPARLKETPNDSGSVCNWLQHRKAARKSWKRYWFKLKEQVLYVYKASEDIRALETIPVLGYEVETFKEVSIAYENINSKLVFQLAHVNQDPLVFYADTEAIADRWVNELRKAVSMSA